MRPKFSLSFEDAQTVAAACLEAARQHDVEVSVANATAPRVRDLLTGTAEKPSRVQAPDGNRLRLTVPVAAYPLILDFNSGASDVFALSSDVQKEALPAVEEIISRHQQVQAA